MLRGPFTTYNRHLDIFIPPPKPVLGFCVPLLSQRSKETDPETGAAVLHGENTLLKLPRMRGIWVECQRRHQQKQSV